MIFVCPKCGHTLEVFIEGIEAFCWHDGTRWQGKPSARMHVELVRREMKIPDPMRREQRFCLCGWSVWGNEMERRNAFASHRNSEEHRKRMAESNAGVFDSEEPK